MNEVLTSSQGQSAWAEGLILPVFLCEPSDFDFAGFHQGISVYFSLPSSNMVVVFQEICAKRIPSSLAYGQFRFCESSLALRFVGETRFKGHVINLGKN